MKCLFIVVFLFHSSLANTPISQSTLDNEGLYPFVVASRPRWGFGMPPKSFCSKRTPPCYPEAAVNHTTGVQNPGQDLCAWPDAGCGCQYPSESGEDGGVKGRPFPHYWIASQCSNTEVRAGFWVYYPKDGFTITGHRHDWEYYIVVWTKQPNGEFIRDYQVFSYHGFRLDQKWSLASTVDDELNSMPNGEGDHALVYPGWSKHPNFPNKNTLWCELFSQLTKNAYRADDWWYYAEESDLFHAEKDTEVGNWIDAIGKGWGAADSYPSLAGGEGRICGLNGTGPIILGPEDAFQTQLVFDNLEEHQEVAGLKVAKERC
ncbi:hypothetical protein BT69DRAFT_1285169 [Atractiella rhizophila]|nr:hypothetical protein BT69DRAFT_1285169 [Atractiella rhizophila]